MPEIDPIAKSLEARQSLSLPYGNANNFSFHTKPSNRCSNGVNLCQLSETDLGRIIKPSVSRPFVFLETGSFNQDNNNSFFFNNFKDFITFNYGDNPDLFFKKIEDTLKKGFWLCGYFAYEFGYFLEPALYHLRAKNKFPLVWLGVCKEPLFVNHNSYKPHPEELQKSFLTNEALYKIENIKSNISQEEYFSKIKKIKYYLEEGLTYQVNFTFKIKFDFQGNPFDFYLNLRRAQPTSYMSFINTGKNFIFSLSPELFFRIDKNNIVSQPMKGTASRGITLPEDRENRNWLKANKKFKQRT